MASGIVEPSQSGSQEQKQQGQQGPAPGQRQLVQRLLANASSLPNFIQDLIRTQARLVAGTEAAAFLIEPVQGQEGQVGLKPVAHIRDDESTEEVRAAALNAFAKLIEPCLQQGKDGALQIEETHDGSDWQYCLVTLLRSEGQVVAASAVITRARDLERAKQRLESMALVAGYFEIFAMRRSGEQQRSIAQSHQHVLQLATSVATADGFESAAMNLCNELASRTGATRVSMGWVKGDTIKLKAISHSEQFDKKQELSVQLVKVMEEAFDNDEIVQYEPDGTSTETVTREAQALSRTQGGESIISLPLRRNGEAVGVVTLEFAPNQQVSPQAATGLAVAVDLLAPQLYDRFQNDRWLITKTGISIREMAKKAMGPTHMLAKTIIALIIGTLLVCWFYKPMYHVKARFSFTPPEERVLSSPFDGTLFEVKVVPGTVVKKDDVLYTFDIREDKLRLAQVTAEALIARQEADKARRADPPSPSDAEQADLRGVAKEAEAESIKLRISRATITAPFDGTITTGDLKDKRGSTFKQGEPLMKIAQVDSLKAKLFVEERDIQEIAVKRKGYLATSSDPSEKFPFEVERIVEGEIKDSGNVFHVYVKPDKTSPEWQPTQEGQAKIEVGPRRLGWIWIHRTVDWIRFKWWTAW